MDHKDEIRAKKRILEKAIVATRQGTQEGVPSHVLEMYESALALPQGRNKALRDIALNAVEKVPETGKWKLCIQSPFFEEFLQKKGKTTEVTKT